MMEQMKILHEAEMFEKLIKRYLSILKNELHGCIELQLPPMEIMKVNRVLDQKNKRNVI